MAGIKYNLQKEVFNAADERILSVCNVTKLFKKRKNSYLCIISTIKPPRHTTITIVQVKQQDKNVYKKKRVWQLDEVKVVDGKNESSDTYEFDIILEKQYKWLTANLHERQNFIAVLYKQINKHVKGERAIFRNIPKSWLIDSSPERTLNENNAIQEGKTTTADDDSSDTDDGYEDFHAPTEREEIDLNKLISECNYAISNAELFMEQLSKNLQDLDGANVQSVLASEKQVDSLMEQIETAIIEADKVEQRLTVYDEILAHTRDTMEKMGEKNTMIEIANTNNIKLMHELEKIVSQLDLSYAHQLTLTDTDLTSAAGLEAAIVAAKALQTCMNCSIDPALLRLAAVQDQRKRFEKWKAKFSQTVSRHLNNMFIHLGNDFGEPGTGAAGSAITATLSATTTTTTDATTIMLNKHSAVHKELSAYGELMHWIKAMDRKAYDGLTRVYTNSMSKIYDREMQYFFEQARHLISSTTTVRDEMNTSTISGKLKTQQQTSQVTQSSSYGILGINCEQWSVGLDPNDRRKFDSILERVLAQLEPVALSEQMFCIGFFQLDVLSPIGGKNTQTTLDAGGNGGGGGADVSATGKDIEKDAAAAAALPQKKIDRQINEEVRRMMVALFGVLETELNNFILSFEKLDSL